MLRVLYISSAGTQGGSDRYAVRLAGGAQRRGVSVTFACRSNSFTQSQCEKAGIAAFPFRPRNSGDLWAAVQLVRLIRERNIQVVHVHSRRDFVTASIAVSLLRTVMRTPPRLFLHPHLIRPLGSPARLGRLLALTADAILVVSHAARAHLERIHDLPVGVTRVLYNGVALEDFAPSGDSRALCWRRRLREGWSVPADAPLIGMVGQLGEKGQHRLIAAAPGLARRIPDVHFALVGPDRHRGDREKYTALAAEAGVGERFRVVGAREDVPAVMAAIDILAHLPEDEAFGLALVEAMAAGVPTVSANVGGCPEIVQDGVTGRLVAPDDASAIDAALTEALSCETRRREWGTAGREAALRFSFDRQCDRLYDLYLAAAYNTRLTLENAIK